MSQTKKIYEGSVYSYKVFKSISAAWKNLAIVMAQEGRRKGSYTGLRQSESYDRGEVWALVSGGKRTRLGSGVKTRRYNFQL